jgi:hypothetical protein
MSNYQSKESRSVLRAEILRFISSCDFRISKINRKIRFFKDIFGYLYIFDNTMGRESSDLYRIQLEHRAGFDVVGSSERIISIGWVFKEELEFPCAITDFIDVIGRDPICMANFDRGLAGSLIERRLDSLSLYKLIKAFPVLMKYINYPVLMLFLFQNIRHINDHKIVGFEGWLKNFTGLDLSDRDVVRILGLIQPPSNSFYYYKIDDDPFAQRDSVPSVLRDLKKLSSYCTSSNPLSFEAILQLRFVLDFSYCAKHCRWINIDVTYDNSMFDIETLFSKSYRYSLEQFHYCHEQAFNYIKDMSSLDKLRKITKNMEEEYYSNVSNVHTFDTSGLRNTNNFEVVRSVAQLLEISNAMKNNIIRYADNCIVGECSVVVRRVIDQDKAAISLLDWRGFPPTFTMFLSNSNSLPSSEAFNDAAEWVEHNFCGMKDEFYEQILSSLLALRETGTIYYDLLEPKLAGKSFALHML